MTSYSGSETNTTCFIAVIHAHKYPMASFLLVLSLYPFEIMNPMLSST